MTTFQSSRLLHLAKVSLALFGIAALVLFLAGCQIREKHDGENKKVDIKTPFGDMKVNTDTNARDTGLSVYPGAQLKTRNGDSDNKANVNINTPIFGLKVVAATYTSADAPDKIISFYANELKKYGDVLHCKGGKVGDVKVKSKSGDSDEQLSCDKDSHDGDVIELKVGTQSKQRVVAVKPDGKGSEFSLVYVQTRRDEGTL